jgi:phage terminase small subunit
MSEQSLVLKKLVERALAKGGDLPLALLLELMVPVRRLRELARKFGLTPKGGFRIEHAPARVLAPLLGELREPSQLDEVLTLLVPRTEAAREPVETQAGFDAQARLSLRESEVASLRDELERAREGATRTRERESELLRRLDRAERDTAQLRRELEAPKHLDGRAEPPPDDRDLQRAVRELEGEREGFVAADAALRRQLAYYQTRLRELEATVTELEALLPKGKRRRKQPPPEPVDDTRRFCLPHFLPSFYKSIEGKERRSVERAFRAILLFCTEGHSYPGLEVKQLGGQDTWSLRASLGLRVYFRPLPDGDIELLELGDREDQQRTLRRLKEH